MKKNFILMIAIAGILGIGFSGCSKDDDNNDNTTPSNPGVTINSEVQVGFKVDGTQVTAVNGAGGVQSYFSNSTLLATFPDTSETVFGCGFEKTVGATTSGVFDIEKGTYYFTTSDSATFSAFFPEQSFSFSTAAASGIRIVYYDAAGDQWSTDAGTGNQSGSSFVIEDTKFSMLSGEKYMKVKAKFNCKVYDGSGASKTITDGVGVFSFWSEY